MSRQEFSCEPASGGCQCGAVRYEFDGPPLDVYVCHCTECRKQSASVHGISVIVPSTAVRLTSGRLEKWTRATDSGNTVDCFFCPNCGSRVWHGNPQTDAEISIKGGSLDQPPDISKANHIWTASKLAGVVIPAGVRQFPGEPDQ